MSAVDRAVEAMPFVVAVRLERVKQTPPLAGLRPAIEPIEDRLPWPEFFWQIAPGHAGTAPPQHGLDKVSVILRRTSRTSLRREHRLYLQPLPLLQLRAHHRTRMEHTFRLMERPCSVHSNLRPPRNC